MDILAVLLAVTGVLICGQGHPLVGFALVSGSLFGFALAIHKRHSVRLILPATHAASLWFLVIALVLSAVAPTHHPYWPAFLIGLVFYHMGYVALLRREVQYVPWGTGFERRRAAHSKHPLIYWGFTALWFSMASLAICGAAASASGWFPREP